MAQGALRPLNPLPVSGERHDRFLKEDVAAPVALKRYCAGEPLLEARVTSDRIEKPDRVEARAKDEVVLSGSLEQGDEKGEWIAGLALDREAAERTVYLPRGALTWHVMGQSDEEVLELEAPELLIFPPEGDLSFAPRGLPVELLRVLASFHGSAALAVAPPWRGLVDQVFNNNPPRYDTVRGAPHFTDNAGQWDNLVFHLSRYQAARTDPTSMLNCYDAAAYLQILLRPTYPTRYCYMNRFGYLRQTNLIGRGQCNNPFGTPLVVAATLPARTCFGNHAFCAPKQGGQEAIADACAGPHYDDTPAGYVAGAVDTQTPTPARCTAGTVANIGYYRGVASVVNLVRVGAEMLEFMTGTTAPAFAANRAAFMRAIGYEAASALVEAQPRGIPDPSAHRALEAWELIHKDLVVGFPESSRQWRYVRDGQSIVITLWAANDPSTARERFLQLGSAHQRGEPIFERGPEGLGDVAAQSLDKERPLIIWCQANMTFRAETSDPGFDLAGLAFELAGEADKGAAPAEPPVIRVLSLSPDYVAVGELFILRVDAEEEAQIDFALSADLATFEHQEGNEIAFWARAPGSLQISVAVVDPRTLLSNQETASVTIEEGR